MIRAMTLLTTSRGGALEIEPVTTTFKEETEVRVGIRDHLSSVTLSVAETKELIAALAASIGERITYG